MPSAFLFDRCKPDRLLPGNVVLDLSPLAGAQGDPIFQRVSRPCFEIKRDIQSGLPSTMADNQILTLELAHGAGESFRNCALHLSKKRPSVRVAPPDRQALPPAETCPIYLRCVDERCEGLGTGEYPLKYRSTPSSAASGGERRPHRPRDEPSSRDHGVLWHHGLQGLAGGCVGIG